MTNLKWVLAVMLILAAVPAAADFKEKRFIAVVGPDNVQHVEVIGGDYYFDPNVIVVKKNVPVELLVKKVEGFTHDIAVKAPEAGIDFAVKLGSEPKSIKFTPTKAGSYPFECTKKAPFMASHKEQGMHGTIEVVE